MDTLVRESSGILVRKSGRLKRMKSILAIKIFSWTAMLFLTLASFVSFGQGVGISETTITPDNSAILELRSISRGFLVPRLTAVQRTSIASPARGLLVYDTDSASLWYYEGGWQKITNQVQLDAIQAELNNTQNGAGLGTNGDYIVNTTANYINLATDLADADDILDDQLKTIADSTHQIQAELDVTQAGAGLNTDGTYTADATTNYITTATSLDNADFLLDDQLKTIADSTHQIQAELDVTQAGAGLNTDGTYTADATTNYITTATATSLDNADFLLDDQLKTIADSTHQIQAELDVTQAGAGLDTDGTYVQNTLANYIDVATDLADADDILDAQLKVIADSINDLNSLTDSHIYIGDASDVAQEVLISGDVTITNTGEVTIGEGKVNSFKIFDGTIVNDDVNAAAAIDAAKISNGVVDNTEFDYLNGVTSAIQTQLDAKVDENAAIVGATKTKITYDAKGLVTSGTDATASDILNVAAGDIAATNVQAAINELDSEKEPLLVNSAGLAAALSDETGTGLAVFATSPSLTTPNIGAATATSINNLALTEAADGFTIAGGTTSRTLTVTGADATLSGSNTGDVTLAGENYLSITNQVITANAVNLSGTNVTGTLAAERFPALTGDVTTTAGSLATTIADNAVTVAKIGTAGAGDANKFLSTNGSGDPYWEDKSVFTPGLVSANIFVGNATGVATAVAMTGDVAIDNTGLTTIQNGAVAVTNIEALADAQFIIGTDGTAANNTKVTMSGDVTMNNTGATTIGAGKVTNDMLAGSINLTTKVTNVLPVANGGTGLSSTTANQILYSSAANTITGLATSNNGVLVTDGSGVPTISSTLPNGVTATTQTFGNNSTAVATTAFVANANYTYAILPALQSTTSTTLVNIPGLSATLEANATYEFEVVIAAASSSNAGNKYGVNFTGTGARVESQLFGNIDPSSVGGESVWIFNTQTDYAYVTYNGYGNIRIQGLVSTSTDSGTFTIQQSKVTSGTATAHRDTYLKIKRVL
ncbi:MAG: hypothetical protein A2W99_15080 [Bacteroidetes bacterium GWF2_33_16]|nr:MAG: hypothetical protein A2W99_15080 [Bacteroidetes bacterium GWF2_33_16]